MRPYILLIFTAVSLAFFSGLHILRFQGPQTASSDDILNISQIKLDFQKNVNPYAIVNFSSLYYSKDQLQLLNPALVIGEFNEDLLSSSKDCSLKDMMTSVINMETKELLWNQFRCKQRTKLPYWFLKRAPFMHPSGSSYAYLVYKRQKHLGAPFTWQWVNDHMGYFHVKELSSIEKDMGALGGIYGILAGLDEKSLYDLSNREGTILTDKYLLAKISYPKTYPILEYRFYLRSDLNEFLETTPYQLSLHTKNKNCIYKDGPLCWRYNTKHLFNMINFTSFTVFAGVMIILVIILWALISKIKQDKREENRRKMALQVLTHEFRTPVASLLLAMEKMNRKIADFDEQTQEDFLRMASEIYRLQRLTERSKNYLQGSRGKGTVHFQFEECRQIEEMILDIIAPLEDTYGKQVKKYIDIEGPFNLDTYWFQIIIKNLIENAMIHGSGEVSIRVYGTKNTLDIEVADEGQTDRSLNELTEAFHKGNKSSGSGLGLNIVATVIKDWGGSLKLSQAPTKFIIKLPNKSSK